jgi:reactive intermediate/imine deaminase
MRWRLPGRAFNALGVPGRKAALEERVRAGEAIGILGYLDGEPVGWCSIARRETYAALERSRDLRRVDDRPAWAVVCFYLRPRARGRGFARRLLQAAVSFARARGATVVEGYPPEPGATGYRWMGSVATFEAAGFRDVGAAGRRRIMRYVVDQGGSGLGACAANRSATLTTDGRTREAVGVGRDIEKRRDDMERTELGRRTGSFAPGIAVEAKRLVFVSGQVSTDANGQVVGKGDVGAQARQAFKNVEVVLAQAGASLQDVVKITTFLVPMERYGEFAAVRAEVFGDRYPASSTVGVASLVSSDYLIEIEAVAVIA